MIGMHPATSASLFFLRLGGPILTGQLATDVAMRPWSTVQTEFRRPLSDLNCADCGRKRKERFLGH